MLLCTSIYSNNVRRHCKNGDTVLAKHMRENIYVC